MSYKNITYKKLRKLKDKRQKKVVALMISVLFLIILLVIIYLTTDIFKSPKTLFYKYLISSNLSQLSDRSYDDFMDELHEHQNYDLEGEIKHRIEDPTIMDASTMSTMNLADDIVTNYQFKTDTYGMYLNLKASYKNEELFNFEVVNNDTVIGAKGKNLQEKYMAIDLSKLKETMEKFGVDSTGINNPSFFHRCDFFDISKEDRTTIVNTYIKHIDTMIPSNDYTVKKNVEIEVSGKKYKCNAYTLKVPDQQLHPLYLRILNELKQDDLTLNLIVEKYNLINFHKQDMTKEMIIEEIQNEINRISSNGPSHGEIEITVYENNSNTIRTEFKRVNEEKIKTICIDVIKGKDTALVLVKADSDGSKSELLINREEISENKSQYKVIYIHDSTKFIFDITNELRKNIAVNIPHFNKENSDNLSEISGEELQKVVSTFDQLYNNGVNTFARIGFPTGVLREFIFEKISTTEEIDENINV